LSGDYNPLHFDGAFAANTKFKQLVVQGGLTTSLLHALVEPVTQLKIKVARQDGESVLEGEAWCCTFSPQE